MSRRRFVALVSALVLLGIGILAGMAAVLVTNTGPGRELVRDYLQRAIATKVHGSMYLGSIRGGLFGGLVIDSLEIRDEEDSLFIATGPISFEWDTRDLVDRRILLRNARIQRPVVHIRQHADGEWNYRRIFPRKKKGAPRPEIGFGDYIVATETEVVDGTFLLTMPWRPDSWLTGARRDSAVAYNLARTDKEVRRTAEGYARTWRWTGIDVEAPRVRISDPDSVGQHYTVARLDVDESDPPFRFRNVAGSARVLGDSLWIDLPHWDLPASTGSARGKITWGSKLPVRYAIHVVGDSVALSDVAWVYPTLPRTGGGSMELDIVNDPQNLRIIDYRLTKMDVRSTGSRLLGSMTYGVGGPVLVVKDVALQAAPVDFALLRTLNGKPFPVDWRGQITGTVTASGGPLTRFRVDDAKFAFRDAHVPGAVTRGTARGELDILYPAFTAFRGLDIDIATLDLRTIQHLFPNFPRLGGTVAGTARLDSSWLDVRFSRADVVHRDGPDEPSRFTGSGRVTWGEQFMTYDVTLQAAALSLTTLARSYPLLPLRGTMQGPVRAKGTVENLDVVTTLAGPAGTLAFEGHLDAYEPGYAVRGKGTMQRVDLRTLLGREDVPSSELSGRYDLDVRGDSVGDAAGAVALQLDRSMLHAIRVYPSTARFRLAGGRLALDTLALETSAATIRATGGLGLAAGRSDSLRFNVLVDSLGGLRHLLTWPRARAATAGGPLGAHSEVPVVAATSDSLAGELSASGTVTGTIAPGGVLDLRAVVRGSGLHVRGDHVDSLRAAIDVRNVQAAPSGVATVTLLRPTVADVKLASLAARVSVLDAAHARFTADAESMNGPRAGAAGNVRLAGDSAFVTLDSLALRVDTLGSRAPSEWRLAGPARILAEPNGLVVDSLVLRNGRAGWIALRGAVPKGRPIDFRVAADSVPLADLGVLAQSRLALGGRVKLDWRVGGLRVRPTMTGGATLTDARIGSMRFEHVNLSGDYRAEGLLETTLNLHRGRRPALVAQLALPVNLALVRTERRLLDAPLRGRVRADSAELAIIETLSPMFQGARGSLTLDVEVGGTVKRPSLVGRMRVASGSLDVVPLGIRLERIDAAVALAGDSIAVDRFTVASAGPEGGSASLTGFVDLRNFETDRRTGRLNPRFDFVLAAREFHGINRRDVADLWLSTRGLRLFGDARGSVLAGPIDIVRGAFFVPDVSRQRLVDLSDPDFYNVVDTSVYANRGLIPTAPPALMESLELRGVEVSLGNEVWLRSAEANIQLGGAVSLTTTRDRYTPRISGALLDTARTPRLALQGELTANRGQYRLNLGVVQRTFDVTKGRLVFSGTPDLNPALDISAVHTVRTLRAGAEQDLRIRVDIGGTLLQPMLTFASDEGLSIEQTELISYLVTGQPSFALEQQSFETAQSILSPTFGGFIEHKLREQFGSAADLVQFELGAGRDTTGSTQVVSKAVDALGSSRLGLGWQINERTFVSANTGICQLFQESQRSKALDQLGVKLEHRLTRGFSVSFGVEPSVDLKRCNDAAQSAVPGPSSARRIGFDLFRKWTF